MIEFKFQHNSNMFQVSYNSTDSRKKQHGIRSFKITKWRCLAKAFVEAVKSFFTNSSFVLLRFAFARKGTKFDMILWISVMITLMVVTTMFVQNFLYKFNAMSTVTIVKGEISTSTIPFPAVTVCSTSWFRYNKIYGFIQNYIIKNQTLRDEIDISKVLKSFTMIDATQNDLEEMDIVLNANNITMKDVFYYTSQSCEELFQTCRWEGVIRPCSELFKKVFAAGSFCCSFNYPISSSSIRRGQYLKTRHFGQGNGLSFVARPIRDKFYYHTDYGTNLRIILHQVTTFPAHNFQNDIFAPLGKETTLEIESVYNTAVAKVAQLPIATRDCVFNWEQNLEEFPIYSYQNCILECRISRIIRACGCATYFFPNINASICPPSKLFCTLLNHNLDVSTNEDGMLVMKNCYCPDDCIVLKMHYHAQFTDFIVSNFSIDEFYQGINENNGIVHISFSKSYTKIFQRKLILDEIQLASNVGGIISLFLGCSFISIFEMLYFFSIRMLKNYRRLCIQNRLIMVPMYLE